MTTFDPARIFETLDRHGVDYLTMTEPVYNQASKHSTPSASPSSSTDYLIEKVLRIPLSRYSFPTALVGTLVTRRDSSPTDLVIL